MILLFELVLIFFLRKPVIQRCMYGWIDRYIDR